MSDRITEVGVGLIAISVGAALLLIVGVAGAVIWFGLLALARWWATQAQVQAYTEEANDIYQSMERELGWDYQAADTLRSVFGIEPGEAASAYSAPSVAHTIFGVEMG
jgi:hypothetical protein